MVDIKKDFVFEDIIKNSTDRRFSAYGSVEIYDRHKELLPIEEFRKALDDWMARGGTLLDNHTNKPIGKALRWQDTTKSGKPAILITGELYKTKAATTVWNEMKKGDREGISVGGNFTSKEETDEGFIVRGLEIDEFSIVRRCGNQGATFENMSLAKGNDDEQSRSQGVESTDETEGEDSFDVKQFQKDVLEKISNLEKMVDKLTETVSGKPNESEEVTKEETTETKVEEVTKECTKEDSKEPTKDEKEEMPEKEEDVKKADALGEVLKEFAEFKKEFISIKEENAELKKEAKEQTEIVKSVTSEAPAQNIVKDVNEGATYSEIYKKVETGEITAAEAVRELSK